MFRMIVLCRISLVLGLLLATSGDIFAQDEVCDSRLKSVPGSIGYGLRVQGQRCEGLYESTVSAVNLEIVSLLKGKLSFDLGKHESLQVLAPDVSGLLPLPVRVRAIALPLRAYYRMDAVLPPSGVLVWPLSDIVERVKLPAEKIGVFGWVGGDRDKIFVPLEVIAEGEEPASEIEAPIEILVRSAVDIEQLVWRTSLEKAPITGWLEYTGVPVLAGQPVALVLPQGEAAVLRFEVAAKRLNNDKWMKLNIQLFRPGR